MIKRNQSSMTLLNNVMTNTIHFSDSVHPVQLRADTSGTDVNVIIVLIAVQLDLRARKGMTGDLEDSKGTHLQTKK